MGSDVQNGPNEPSRYKHDYSFDKSVEGYGICECGVRENSDQSVRVCIYADDELSRLREENERLRQDRDTFGDDNARLRTELAEKTAECADAYLLGVAEGREDERESDAD